MPRFRLAALLVVAFVSPPLAGRPTVDSAVCLAPYTLEAGGGGGLALAAADLDGDGAADLAVGAPAEDSQAGTLRAFEVGAGGFQFGGFETYGGGGGLGAALAAGDFDDDGAVELVAGWPRDGGGAVILLARDGATSLTAIGELRQGLSGIPGTDEAADRFGEALAVGDFDADGYADLAIGIPGEDWPILVFDDDQGAVMILYGGEQGLDGARYQIVGEHDLGGVREANDQFGQVLAAADFDGDGDDDLAIGAPEEDALAGAVYVVPGSGSGLLPASAALWSQASGGIFGAPAGGDRFGAALAAGDLDGDGFADLAIGVPDEPVSDQAGAGIVHLLFGDAGGLSAARADVLFAPGGAVAFDAFGSTLLAARLDGDGRADLVVRSAFSYELAGEASDSGALFLYFGRAGASPAASGLAPWRTTSIGCLGGFEQADGFGASLAAGDFDGDGIVDLALAAAGWSNDASEADRGAVAVLFGALFADGFEGNGATRWSSAFGLVSP
jgi:hypothetical protein